jgi:hypothetical protein
MSSANENPDIAANQTPDIDYIEHFSVCIFKE